MKKAKPKTKVKTLQLLTEMGTLHELLGAAIEDVRKCVEQGMRVDTGEWVALLGGMPCEVCLAGASLVRRHADLVSEDPYFLGRLPQPLADALRSINELRSGYLLSAVRWLKSHCAIQLPPDTDYKFWRKLAEIQAKLSQTGYRGVVTASYLPAWLADLSELQQLLETHGV